MKRNRQAELYLTYLCTYKSRLYDDCLTGLSLYHRFSPRLTEPWLSLSHGTKALRDPGPHPQTLEVQVWLGFLGSQYIGGPVGFGGRGHMHQAPNFICGDPRHPVGFIPLQ